MIVCRSGGRSKAITQLLTARGITAVNVEGGMRVWEQAGLPILTPDGNPGTVV